MKWLTPVSMLFLLASLAAEIVLAQSGGTISGRVVAERSEGPLSGARVTVQGTDRAATTDANGLYTIGAVPPGTHRVTASVPGYQLQVAEGVQITAGQTRTLNFQLANQDALQLEGVVAVGYGTQSRRDITGAIGSVSTEELEKVQVPTIAQALQGRVAGVQVTQNSSAPGGGVSVRIRGSGSIGTTNEPLYVIDGIPISGGDDHDPTSNAGSGARFTSPNPLSFLNPEDIGSIEVLKDASSTAIYGARGTNGVVLITTKKGRPGLSRMEVESSFGVQEVAKRYDMLNAREFAEYANEYVRIEHGSAAVPFPDPAALGEGVDYQELIYRDAPTQEHQVSILGGSDQTQFALSGNYADQQGVVRSSEFQRYSVRANIQHEMRTWLNIGANLNMSRVNNSVGFTAGGARGPSAGAVDAALHYLPVVPVFDEDGNYTRGDYNFPPELLAFGIELNDFDNPLAIINETTDLGENDRMLGNLFVEFDLLEGMMLRVNGGANLVNNSRNEYFSSRSIRGSAPNNGIADLGVVEHSHYVGEAILSYRRSFGELHRVDFTTGITAEQGQLFQRNMVNRNFPNDVTRFYNIGAGVPESGPNVRSSYSESSLLSYLGRLNYSLADKYLFTLTGRADGSSKFGADNRWGYFPSAAFAWRASEEPFLRGIGWLSDLKLRVSYGITGNQEIGSYQSLARWGLSNYNFNGTLTSGFRPISIPNPELRWEKSEQFDAGFDAALLDNSVTLTFDVYNKLTDDLLLDVPLPAEVGYTSALQNLGSVRNRGVELGVGADVFDGIDGGLRWSTSFNISANRNEVLDLGERDEIFGSNFAGGVGVPGLLVREGLPMGVFYGHETDGIFRSQQEIDDYRGPDGTPIQRGAEPGQVKFVDQNGDGKLDAADRVVLGSPEPDFTFGWTNDLTFGAFGLYTFVQGTAGNEIYSVTMREFSRGGPSRNVYAPLWYDAWSPQNPNGSRPAINVAPGGGPYAPPVRNNMTDEFLFDGSYVRLRNVTLSYDLPQRWATRIGGMQSARIFMNGENLFTWTDYPGLNPDVNTAGQNNISRGIDFGGYPLARTYRIGMRLGL